jgi:AcrR family transcriptional regulator
VDLETESSSARRRRGQELEDALLEAAWDELSERGYSTFTFEAVADRAGTSRPVLGRRWKTKVELVVAAVSHELEQSRLALPDTGTLRGDIIELLRQANDRKLRTAAVIAVQLGAYFQETGTAPSDLRAVMIGDRALATDILVKRAMDRGEIPTRDLPPRVVSLPFDLARHELLMTLKPLEPSVILQIVDEIFLPLVNR